MTQPVAPAVPSPSCRGSLAVLRSISKQLQACDALLKLVFKSTAFLAASLGVAYMLCYCVHEDVPFPLSLGALSTLMLLVLCLSAYGTTMFVFFLFLPAFLSRVPLHKRSWGERAWEFGLWLALPLIIGCALVLCAVYGRFAEWVGWFSLFAYAAILGISSWISARKRRAQEDGAPFSGYLAVSAASVVWLGLLTLLLLKGLISISGSDGMKLAGLIFGWLLFILFLFFQLVRGAQFWASPMAKRVWVVVGYVWLFAIIPVFPPVLASGITSQALQALHLGGYERVRMTFTVDGAASAPMSFDVDAKTRTSCTVFLVLDGGGEYHLRASNSLTDPLVSIPRNAVVRTERGGLAKRCRVPFPWWWEGTLAYVRAPPVADLKVFHILLLALL